MKAVIQFAFDSLGKYWCYIDGYKTYIVGVSVLIIGLASQDAELVSIGILALTGKHAITKVVAK